MGGEVHRGLPPWSPAMLADNAFRWPWQSAARFVYPEDTFGPPGTMYLFSAGDVISAVLPIRVRTSLLAYAGLGSAFWRVPMQWLRAAIHAQLGATEQMLHTFNLTPHGPTPAALPSDGAGLLAVGQVIAGLWSAALNAQSKIALNYLGTGTVYDEVRMSVLEQTNPRDKYGKGGPIDTILPTVSAPILPHLVGTSSSTFDLPYEVACAVTLTTRRLGPSYRGRVFMGGLGGSMMTNNGMFHVDAADRLGQAVGRFAQTIRDTTPWQLTVISGRHLDAHEIVGTKTGRVPDAQRRRRQGQTENPVINWTYLAP